MSGIRLDGIDHMPNWTVVGNASIATYMFPMVNAIPSFAPIKIETVSKVIMGFRRMLQMFKTKLTLFKVNNRKPRTRCKICSNLTIKTPK